MRPQIAHMRPQIAHDIKAHQIEPLKIKHMSTKIRSYNPNTVRLMPLKSYSRSSCVSALVFVTVMLH